MKTFKQATADHLDTLAAMGWTVRRDLKVPHATDATGLRLWFKPQAVYFSRGTDLGAARSIHAEMRTATTAKLVADALYFATRAAEV